MRVRNLPLILLILSYTVPFPSMVRSSELGVIEIETPADLLSHVTAMDMKLEDYEGNEAFFGYRIMGEDEVRGFEAWIVLWNFSTAGGEGVSEFSLWVSKIDGKVVQVEIEGEKITDSTLTTHISNLTFGFFTEVIYQSWSTWDYNELQSLPHGELMITGNGTEQYGPTTLNVLKYQFTGTASVPEQYRYAVEAWTAPTTFGSVVTYLYVESVTEDKWFSWEVESIELAEAQVTTEEPPLNEEEEPEAEEEPVDTVSEQESKSIPGFPIEATLVGVFAAILFMYIHIRKTGSNVHVNMLAPAGSKCQLDSNSRYPLGIDCQLFLGS